MKKTLKLDSVVVESKLHVEIQVPWKLSKSLWWGGWVCVVADTKYLHRPLSPALFGLPLIKLQVGA